MLPKLEGAVRAGNSQAIRYTNSSSTVSSDREREIGDSPSYFEIIVLVSGKKYLKGWVPWTERTILLDAVLMAPHETIIFMSG